MVYYRCKKAKPRGSQCSLLTYLLYHTETDKVNIYKTEAAHGHHVTKFVEFIKMLKLPQLM